MGCSNSKANRSLHESVANGDIIEVRRLVDCPHFQDTRDAAGCTALHTASRVGQLEIVQLLLHADANGQTVNMQNEQGWTALMGEWICCIFIVAPV